MVELSDTTTPTGGGMYGCYHRIARTGGICAEHDRAHHQPGSHAWHLGPLRTAYLAAAGATAALPVARARHRTPLWLARLGRSFSPTSRHVSLWRQGHVPPRARGDCHDLAGPSHLYPRYLWLCQL